MAFVTKETKEKINTLVKEVRDYAGIVEQSGLHMDTEVSALQAKADSVEAGLFNTLVMGKFKNGKSTFINSLVGKNMMASKASACTAVIATVEFGHNTDQVNVVYTDGTVVSKTLDQFTKEFQLTKEDQDLVEEGGRLDRFANVDHVEMQSDDSLFADGVHLIDSPGLEEDVSRTTTTNKYVPQADAIIFMLNAISLFSEKERAYITENFEGKCRRNLFFVVNRINQVSDPSLLESDVKPNVRKNLHGVFADENGIFDEELYKKRVFFVDAYCAYCARTQTPMTIMVGKKEIPVEADIEDSGILEFEDALREFLNSGDRLSASFESIMSVMADSYRKAQKQAELDKASRSQSRDERKANAEAAEKDLKEAEAKLQGIQNLTKKTGQLVADKIYGDLLQFVQNDIPNNFAAYVKENGNFKAHYGAIGSAKMAAIRVMAMLPSDSIREKMDDKMEALLRPMANAVNGYINDQMKTWEARIPTLVSGIMQDYQEEMEAEFEDFALNLENAKNTFAYGSGKKHTAKSSTKQTVQTIFSMIQGDFSHVTNINQNEDNNWGNFFKGYAIQGGLNLGLAFLFGGTSVFLPAWLAVEAVSIIAKSDENSRKQATAIGKECFDNMVMETKRSEMDMKRNLQNQLNEKVAPLIQTAQSTVDDTRNHMETILEENDKSDVEAAAANLRADNSIAGMKCCIDSVFETLNGHRPSDIEFARLGKNEKEEQFV